MDRPELTDRQRVTYAFIGTYLETFQRPPSLAEIAEALGVRSVNSVRKLVLTLERKGYIERDPGRARGIRLTETDPGSVNLETGVRQLLIKEPHPKRTGRAAGIVPERMQVDERFFRGVSQPASCFMVRSGDHGMAQDGIQRSDLIVVEPVSSPRLVSTDLVVCLLDGEYLVRRYVETAAGRRLLASDRTYPPIYLDSIVRRAQIQGRVIGVLRRL